MCSLHTAMRHGCSSISAPMHTIQSQTSGLHWYMVGVFWCAHRQLRALLKPRLGCRPTLPKRSALCICGSDSALGLYMFNSPIAVPFDASLGVVYTVGPRQHAYFHHAVYTFVWLICSILHCCMPAVCLSLSVTFFGSNLQKMHVLFSGIAILITLHRAMPWFTVQPVCCRQLCIHGACGL